MAFSPLCKTDPLLDFIRDTYQVVPIRLPDARWRPLALFTVDQRDRSVRYLGHASELSYGPGPLVERVKIPHVEYERSGRHEWGATVGVVAPFMSALLGIPLPDLEASVTARIHRRTAVQISLGRTVRSLASVLGIASWLEAHPLVLPTPLPLTTTLYIVDATVSARELHLSVEGERASEFTALVAAAIAGNVEPSRLARSETRLKISGTVAAPFGFSCLEVEPSADRSLAVLRLPVSVPKAAATGVHLPSEEYRVQLAASDELMEFDSRREAPGTTLRISSAAPTVGSGCLYRMPRRRSPLASMTSCGIWRRTRTIPRGASAKRPSGCSRSKAVSPTARMSHASPSRWAS
ncbi:hypothetical protein [Streptomyces sp. DSM 40750]|uniref:hypothetical protein n=1 Tax=Streptomyces sp. DSM 40750 TaxID=2801030 RepID=UPI00214C45DF|nr:hypothetical protein [Streptomyces sp. DSM 40750]UUU25863.1 hypothetical protein JIX55_39620 [Streptomyces sp. DSM 40750]